MKNLISRIARNRTEDGFTLAEVAVAITAFGLIATLVCSWVVSATVKFVPAFSERVALTEQVNLTNSFVYSNANAAGEFRLISNCEDEANTVVRGLAVTPSAENACVKIWGTTSTFKTEDGSLPPLPAYTIEVTANGERHTYDSTVMEWQSESI